MWHLALIQTHLGIQCCLVWSRLQLVLKIVWDQHWHVIIFIWMGTLKASSFVWITFSLSYWFDKMDEHHNSYVCWIHHWLFHRFQNMHVSNCLYHLYIAPSITSAHTTPPTPHKLSVPPLCTAHCWINNIFPFPNNRAHSYMILKLVGGEI